MAYVSIMTYVEGDEASNNRTRLAAQLADRFEAMLIGVATSAPRPPVSANGDLMAREIEAEVAAASKELAAKEKQFLSLASQLNRQVEWRASGALPNDAVPEEARAADLIVIGNGVSLTDPWRSLDPGAVLLKAGRPVLVLPPGVSSLSGKKVLIAWQDSREARRAVLDSLPFLQQADEILLTQVCEQDESERAKQSVRDVARYLSRHRIGASAGIMLMSGGSVADELTRIAEREGIDLIIAGAYGHSRMGEWVFGGVTRDLLTRCPVCCLFSH